MRFEIVGAVHGVEVIAKGPSVRIRALLRTEFGPGRWRKLKGTAMVRLRDGPIWRAELHWYEAHAIGRRRMKIKRFLESAMRENRRRYALCVQAEKDEDLEVRKVYEVLPDELAATRGHLRVVDESGEDYLYPADAFVLLDLPEEAEHALLPKPKGRSAKHANPALQRPGSARRLASPFGSDDSSG